MHPKSQKLIKKALNKDMLWTGDALKRKEKKKKM